MVRPNYTEFNKLVQRFKTETDRGAAVLTCSHLEVELENLLRVKMRNGETTKNLFKGFAPLSTFAGKIDVCYSFRFIDKGLLNDLRLLAQIRNQFAHKTDDISFESERIAKNCEKLSVWEEWETFGQPFENHREAYLFCVSMVTVLVHKSMETLQNMSPTVTC